ncbi:LRR 8 domain containing protein [Asbolus verrucosus]|uniref:LRR 8 domain containing protein n=1 Tax=Asbolus verrucosus TaxID=1661398 RepID=A0A482VY04_ASBVE|nr:LRR 8 domain containing protein [Asbolus verrucosus]
MKLLPFIPLPLLLLGVSSQDLETKNKCSYTLGKSVFACAELTDVNKNVDQFLTPNTRMLIIKTSEKAMFTPYHHNKTNYKYVVNYNIVENNKLDIEEMAFYGMVNLRYMKINGNSYSRVKNHTFKGLDSLELLNLAGNNISEIEKDAFSGLQNLITLDIANNNVDVVKSNLFSDLINLKTLLLERNNIKIVEENGFFGLTSLNLLDLNFNSIRTPTFSKFATLKYGDKVEELSNFKIVQKEQKE